jgi:hypothetical protein
MEAAQMMPLKKPCQTTIFLVNNLLSHHFSHGLSHHLSDVFAKKCGPVHGAGFACPFKVLTGFFGKFCKISSNGLDEIHTRGMVSAGAGVFSTFSPCVEVFFVLFPSCSRVSCSPSCSWAPLNERGGVTLRTYC